MDTLKRAARIVRPREPYRAWTRSLETHSPIDTMADLTNVYLVDVPDAAEPEHLIRANFTRIFDEQLHSWMRDPKTWPKRRTYDLFQEWFHVEVAEIVWDLGRTLNDLVD